MVTTIPTYLNSDHSSSANRSLKSGAIAGIVVAVVAVLSLIILLAFFIRRREIFNQRRELQKKFLPRSMLREEVDAFDLAEGDPVCAFFSPK